MKQILSLAIVLACSSAFADITKPLPKGDRLAQVAKAIGTRLSDENIAGGTNDLWAGKLIGGLPSDTNSLKKLANRGYRDAIQNSEGSVPRVLVQIKVSQFSKKTVEKMAEALMEANDYNPDSTETYEAGERSIWAVLRQLPVDSDTTVVHVTTKVFDNDRNTDVNVQYFLLANSDGKAVQFFTMQGSM